MTMCAWCKHNGQCRQPQWIIINVQADKLYCEGFKPLTMPSISFGYTSACFTSRNKSVTRRNWASVTVKRFKKDVYFIAWSKQARFGGEPVGIGRMAADCYKQFTGKMTYDQYIKEGFEFLDLCYYDSTYTMPLKDVFERWRNKNEILTVVPFEIVEVFPGMLEKYSTDDEIIRCVKALVKVIG